jgi:diadenosine tetraphosphate (Ap4A) HIT family hydrolase
MGNAFVNQNNTKYRADGTYGEVIEKIGKDKVCPFCPEHLAKYHTNPILRAGEYWLVTDNLFPYPGAKHHVLLIHRDHIENITELSRAAWDELWECITWVIRERKIPGGSLVFRFGDTAYTGASVAHLHANLASADGENADRAPIVTRIG